MDEVVSLIYEIKDIIDSKKAKNKEKISQLEQDKEQVLKSFNDKNVELSKLSKKYQDLLQDYNTIKNSLKESVDSMKSFKDKTLGTVKYLVSRIEKFESEENDKSKDYESKIHELERHLYDKNNEEKIDLSQYITLRKYNEDIEKVEKDKQTTLENTWKEQQRLTTEVEEKSLKIAQLTEDIARMTNTINTLTSENEGLKIKNIEAERKSEQYNLLETTNKELSAKVEELTSTLSRYRDTPTSKPTIVKRIQSVSSENNESKNGVKVEGTAKYHFGVTTKTIIDKVKEFITEIYNGSTKEKDGTYILSNLIEAKDKIGLTDKEYSVFIGRLQEMEGPNGMPLLIIVDNKARSYFDKDWMIQYVSGVYPSV